MTENIEIKLDSRPSRQGILGNKNPTGPNENFWVIFI